MRFENLKIIAAVSMIALASFIFYTPALAHTGAQPKNNDEISELTATIIDPDIFIAKTLTPIFIEIKDRNTDKKITGLNPLIEITDSKGKEIFTVGAEPKGENYFFEYTFSKGGNYTIHLEFKYKNKAEKLNFNIFAGDPVSESRTASIVIFIIGGLLLILTIVLGISKKKTKAAIVWSIIIIIATLLAYSVFLTLKANPSLGIVTCPNKGTCWWTAHIHAFVPVSICGENIRLPIEVGRLDRPHAHEEKNIIHWHDKLAFDKTAGKIMDTEPLTLGAFFDSIKIKFDQNSYDGKKNGDLCPNGASGTLKVFANGKLLKNPRDFIWKDKDVIMIFFDGRSTEETEAEIRKNPIKYPALGRG